MIDDDTDDGTEDDDDVDLDDNEAKEETEIDPKEQKKLDVLKYGEADMAGWHEEKESFFLEIDGVEIDVRAKLRKPFTTLIKSTSFEVNMLVVHIL